MVIIFNGLNEELINISMKLREKERLVNILNKDQELLFSQTEKLRELGAILDKEGSDLKKLESMSLTGLFYTILGNKDQQLEKERQEYLSVKLKYDEAQKVIGDLEAGISNLRKDLIAYEGIEKEYERVMGEKERYILEHKDAASGKLMGLIEELARLKSFEKELGEAVFAGNRIKEALQCMIESLESAGNWGTWDMLGGGFLATAVKHSRIDESRDHASRVQQLLREFKHELEDVSTYSDLNMNISSFETFADYFFDGLIFDWIVQSKINDSLNNAWGMKKNIDNIMEELDRKLKQVKSKSLSIEKERSNFVEGI